MTAVLFDLPAETIVPVRRVCVRLDPQPHPFETANLAAIERNWQREQAANPALFDGKVALPSSLVLRGDMLSGRCHFVRFASFLYWRSVSPAPHAGHFYAHAMPVTADNALVAVRMGPTTSNAGQVYFAAGTFEAADFRDGQADPEFNMVREVLEETGLDLAGMRHEPGYHAISKASGTVLFRRYFLDAPAEDVARRIRAHVASQAEPEIEGPVIIRNEYDLPQGSAPQMPDLVRWHFAGEG